MNEKYIILLQVYTQRSQTGLGRGQNNPLASSRGGLYRSPSMEFKEVTKKDAEVGLSQELDKLRRTGVGTVSMISYDDDRTFQRNSFTKCDISRNGKMVQL